MSAPIRPLPVEAAPQRTESDATTSFQPETGTPGFGDVLNIHLSTTPKHANSVEDSDSSQSDDGKSVPAKKPREQEISAWAILGTAFVPPPITPTADVERGSFPGVDPRLLPGAIDSTEADPRTGGIHAPSPDSSPPLERNSPEVAAAALKQLTPVPEIQSATAEVAPKEEEIAPKPPETGQKLRGIPVAKQGSMPLAPEKTDQLSSQELRSSLASAGNDSASAPSEVPSEFRAARPLTKATVRPIEFAIEKFTQADSFTAPIRVEMPVAPIAATHASDLRAAAVIDSIREHVQIVRISQQNELNVVLRPDAHTELSLQIRHVDGQIYLQARCERGDFTWLDSNWSALQNTLAPQGVRVEPLQAAFRAHDGNGSMFMHDQRGSQQQPQRGAAPDFTFEQELSKPRIISARPNAVTAMRGWQTWA